MVDILSLSVLGCPVTVQCEDTEAHALLLANYGQMQGAQAPGAWQYIVRRPYGSSAFLIIRAGQSPLVAADAGEFLWRFEKDLTIELQQRRHDLYFVHSGVLEVAGNACLLVGPSGSGKSTLTWALLHHGYRYLSDELAPIDLDTLHVYPYPHALCLKEAPPRCYPLPETTLSTAHAFYLPLAEGARVVEKDPAPLAAIFFVRYCPQAAGPTLDPISKAEAGARLFAHALNALAHPGDGLDAALAIVTQSACFTLDTAELPATCALLTDTVHRLFSGAPALEKRLRG